MCIFFSHIYVIYLSLSMLLINLGTTVKCDHSVQQLICGLLLFLSQTFWPCGRRRSGRKWGRGSAISLRMKLWLLSSTARCRHPRSSAPFHILLFLLVSSSPARKNNVVCPTSDWLLCVCLCVFQEQPTIAAHSFKEGMKLEAVDPAAPISIRPATVTKVGGRFLHAWL